MHKINQMDFEPLEISGRIVAWRTISVPGEPDGPHPRLEAGAEQADQFSSAQSVMENGGGQDVGIFAASIEPLAGSSKSKSIGRDVCSCGSSAIISTAGCRTCLECGASMCDI